MDLFRTPGGGWEIIELPGADLRWQVHWLDDARAHACFEAIAKEVSWETHRIRVFGREVDSPRLSCWVGDPGMSYTYSRTRFDPHPWTPTLRALRHEIELACDARFNSVLVNLYRHGDDAMGWHSDDESELGPRPVIASLSLGAQRDFRFRHRGSHRQACVLPLSSGSLLRMAGDTQRLYQHDLPRRRGVREPRINLTFRWLQAMR